MSKQQIIYGMALFIMLAGAVSAIDTTSQPYPAIESVFNEQVQLRNATLNDSAKSVLNVNVSDGTRIVSLPALTPHDTWIFTPLSFLKNLVHTLRVNASDVSGNSALFEYSFIVDAPSQSVTLLDPENGGTRNATNLTIVVETQYESTCRWDISSYRLGTVNQFKAMRFAFNTTTANGRHHTINNFYEIIGVNPTPNVQTNLSVTCNWTNVLTPEVFPIVYLTSPPVLQVTNTPRPIVDADNPVTNITVESDQEIWCSLNSPYDTTFGEKSVHGFNKVLRGNYTDTVIDVMASGIPVDILCENRAGDTSFIEYTIDTAYNSAVVITPTSPAYTRTATYTLGFRTNRPASCSATLNNSQVTLTQNVQPLATTFSSNVRLEQGGNEFVITCTTPLQQQPSVLEFTVSMDTVAPTLTSIDAKDPTCDLSRLFWTFNASDPQPGSGIAGFNYTVKDAAGVIQIPWTTTNETTVDERGLTLRNGTRYTVTAYVFDNAGNGIGTGTKTKDITATDKSGLNCDKVPPTTSLVLRTANVTGGGTNVGFICDDGGTPCKDSLWFSIKTNLSEYCPTNGVPSATMYTNSSTLNASFIVRQNVLVCWSVVDRNGLYAYGSQQVKANTTVPLETCTDGKKNNQETDVDCGGAICATRSQISCALNKACNDNRDCASKACRANLCVVGSCTDGQQNGNETGVDCGGTCGACSTFGGCETDDDCSGSDICEDNICVEEFNPTNSCDPTYEDCGETPGDELPETTGGFGLINIILIILGAILILSGGGYIVLYRQPTTMRNDTWEPYEPVDNIEKPLVISPAQQDLDLQPAGSGKSDAAQRKRDRKRNKLRKALQTFESPEDLASVENVTHHEIEKAYESFDKETFAETTQNLIEQEKVDKKDVAVALADAASKPDADHEAIDDLRKTFGLTDDLTKTDEEKGNESAEEKAEEKEETEKEEDEKSNKKKES